MAFNEQQKQVILEQENPTLVISSAGSGKSTLIVGKVVKMIREDKKNILCITFTKKTKEDLIKKFKALGLQDKVYVGTFHSLMREILIKEGYQIDKKLKQYEIENIFKKIINDGKSINTDDILSFISFQKNNMIGCDDEFADKESDYDESTLRECYQSYEVEKDRIKAYDFDDYLLLGYKVLMENKGKYIYDYLLLDEAQDSNEIQFNLIDLLCPSFKMTIVGDYRQSMYSFRSAKPELFMDFYKNHPGTKIVNMNINYRSNIEIVERSNYFIKQYYSDYKYYSDAIPNSKETANIEFLKSISREEESLCIADKVTTLLGLGYKGSDIAILYRNNVHSQYIENEFKQRNIDYFIDSEGGFFNRKEIDIIMCILRLIDNPKDDSAYEMLFKYRCEPFTFLSNDILRAILLLSSEDNISHFDASVRIPIQYWQKKNLQWFYDVINKLRFKQNNGIPLITIINDIITTFKMEGYIRNQYPSEEDQKERLESIENLKKFIRNNTLDSFLKFVYEKNTGNQKINDTNKIQLMTVHKSKGLQFKCVFVVGLESEKFPSNRSSIKEEANVFYVSVTRSIERLYLSQIGAFNQFCEEYFGKKQYGLLNEITE